MANQDKSAQRQDHEIPRKRDKKKTKWSERLYPGYGTLGGELRQQEDEEDPDKQQPDVEDKRPDAD